MCIKLFLSILCIIYKQVDVVGILHISNLFHFNFFFSFHFIHFTISNVGLRSCSKWLDHEGLLQSWWFYKQIFYQNSTRLLLVYDEIEIVYVCISHFPFDNNNKKLSCLDISLQDASVCPKLFRGGAIYFKRWASTIIEYAYCICYWLRESIASQDLDYDIEIYRVTHLFKVHKHGN